jgi:hypothetical protein
MAAAYQPHPQRKRAAEPPPSELFLLPTGRGAGEANHGSRTALRGAVSGRLVFNETARPVSPALCRGARLRADIVRTLPQPGTKAALPGRDLCEMKTRRRFASLALGPGSPSTPLRCVAGVRESAVEGFAPIPPRLSRAHAAQAELRPGTQRKTLPRSGAESRRAPVARGPLRQLRTRKAPHCRSILRHDAPDAQHDRRRRAS